MRQRIPSLSSLRAFEAAGSHLNLRRAAKDLFITESAVSRQIIALEKFLGVELFRRANKRVTLTAAGAAYSRQVREVLAQLERNTLDVMAHEGSGGIVELACVPTLAVEWLIPRLPDFYARHPQVVVNISAKTDFFFFDGAPYDASIHYGTDVYPGARTDLLFGEESIVVCRPDFFAGRTQVSAQEVAMAPRLHLASRALDWKHWIESAGVDLANPMSGARFEHHTMVISAVRAGLGLGLVPRFLVEQYLIKGELLSPVRHFLRSSNAYYFVTPDSRPTSDAVAGLREWLLAAAHDFACS